MKLPLITLTPFLVWGMGGLALAQQAATPPAPSAPLKRSVTLPSPGTSLDDDLIALGRAAKINVIADASTWPADAPALSGARTGNPNRLLAANEPLALSWLGQGDTVLVWARPDILALGRRIAAGESIQRIAVPPIAIAPIAVTPNAPSPPKPLAAGTPRFSGLDIQELIENARRAQNAEPQAWNARWNEYLSTLAPAQKREPGWTRDVALSDLPPDLHDFVLAHAQEFLLPTDLMEHWKAWMTEDFWKTARLNIRDVDTMVAGKTATDPLQKRALSMLFIRNTLQVVPGQRGNTMMSIAVLGDAPATTAPNTPAPTP